jgi:hypothetical protein
MNAKQAARMTAQGKQRAERERVKEALKAEKQRQDQVKFELKRVPAQVKEIYKYIAEATKHGHHVAHWSTDGLLEHEARDKIVAILTKKGYKVEVGYRQGESDMGDFNAPCVCSWSRTDFTVSW